MANTIITKNSSTASAVPTAGDLVQGELAVNVTDKRLFTEDAGGNIVEIGTNPSTINIDAGTIDGTAIGGTTPTTGAFTTLTANTSLTASTADINGGTIDGTTIGGTTAAAGAFTTLSASGAVTLSGGTANGVAYLNGSKVLTSGSALTFDGTSLGIGTSSPSKQLEIKGSAATSEIRLSNSTAVYSNLYSDSNGILILAADGGGTGGAASLRMSVGGTERLRIDSSGNLGLGVTPSAWSTLRGLQVGNASLAGFQNFAYLNSNAFYDGSAWKYIATGFAAKYDQVNSAHAWYTAPSGTAGNAISFTQAMTLTSTGLGIGTSSPAYKLDVVGNAGIARIQSTGSGQNAQLNLQSTAATWSIGQNITLTSTGTLEFYNGSTRLQLDSSGNLGLGVTPSAWDVGSMKALQVVGANFVGDTAGVYRVRVVANGYFNGGWKYQQNNYATQYVQNGADGTHAWYTAPSGTAGNAISFSQVMTLTAAGNLGIGTSSPGDKIELGGNGSGIIIRSPNGTRYRLTVTDLGVLSIAAA